MEPAAKKADGMDYINDPALVGFSRLLYFPKGVSLRLIKAGSGKIEGFRAMIAMAVCGGTA